MRLRLSALVVVTLVGVGWGCKVESARAPCDSDVDCATDEVCFVDGRCLARAVAVRVGEVGDECRVERGVVTGCDDGVCRTGFCVPSGGHHHGDADAGMGDAGVPRCGGGDADNAAPLFGGASTAFADGSDAVVVRWFPAADETPPAQITYRVFMAEESGAQDLDTPAVEVIGTTEHRFTGLTAGTTYFFVVHAVDESGLVACAEHEVSATPQAPPSCVDYADVQALLSSTCTRCHAGADPPQGLRLDSFDNVMLGSQRGPVIIGCRPDTSLLFLKVSLDTPPVGVRMPRDGPPYLSDFQIELLRQWIAEGARPSCDAPDICSDAVPPTFAGVASAELVGDNGAHVCWAAPSDDVTAAADIAVDLYQAPSAADVNFGGTASATVADGSTCVDVTGLAPGSTQCFGARARDQAGNSDTNTAVLCVDVPAAACVDYATMIQPIFSRECVHCHSGVDAPQGLRLTSFDDVRAGSARGPVLLPCVSTESLLFDKVALDTPPVGLRMPRDGPPYLTAIEIDLIGQWIEEGARSSCAEADLCSDVVPPTFAGVASATLTTDTAAQLCWAPANDDVTAAGSIVYDAFLGPAADAVELGTAVASSAPGASCLEVASLLPGTTACFTVRARDAAGNRDDNTVARCIDVPAATCIDYATMVQPIFDGECIHCHSGAAAPQGLELTSFASVVAGSDRGAVLIGCRPDESLLVQKVALDVPPVGARMPRDGPPYLTASQIDVVRRWVAEGARPDCSAPDVCSDANPPTFAGIGTATLIGPAGAQTAARLCWTAGSDDVTPPTQLVYDLYRGATAAEASTAADPFSATGPGAVCTDVAGLLPGEQVCFTVRARDAAGNRDDNTASACVDVPAAACVDYESVIQPIFRSECIHCHSGPSAPQGLQLDSYAHATAGGRILPCNADQSLLVQKVALDVPPVGARMPRDGPPYLSAGQIDAIRAWVDEGARPSCAAPDVCSDAVPPTFAGAASATPLDATHARVCWAAGSDNLTATSDLVYDVWLAPAGPPAAPTVVSEAGQTCVEVAALPPGVQSCFVVQARDSAGNRDGNQVQRCASLPSLPAGCVSFDRHVLPLFERNCVRCHAGASAPQKLRLGAWGDVLAGSVRRNTVEPCDAGASLILQKVGPNPPIGLRMPRDAAPLATTQIQLLSQWIANGASLDCAAPTQCTDATAPTFGGVTTASALDSDTGRVCFSTASDNVTSAARLRYEVHERTPGQSADGLADKVVLGAELANGGCVDVPGAPDATICYAGAVVDEAGNRRSAPAVERCVSYPPAGCSLDFPTEVLPVLQARCTHCHSGATPPRKLLLGSYGDVIAGGVLRSEVVACDAASSVLSQKVKGTMCGQRMPFDGPPWLSPSDIARVDAWLEQGARAACTDPLPCSDVTDPTFAGADSAIAVGPTSIEVCWSPAVDDATPPSSMVYELYNTSASGVTDYSAPAHAVATPGASCITMAAPTGVQSCFVVRARDLAGNRDANRRTVCATTPGMCFDYDDLVQPIFTMRCVHCHSGGNPPKGVRLDSYATAIDPDVIRPCRSGNSKLIEKVDRCEMPYDTSAQACGIEACLTPLEQSILTQWVDDGAPASCPSGGCP